MKIIQKIMLAMLVISGTSSVTFGMEYLHDLPLDSLPADAKSNLLIISASRGDFAAVKLVLESIPAAQRGEIFNIGMAKWWCIFTKAAFSGDLELVNGLIEIMPSENISELIMTKDENRASPLYYAAMHNNVAMVIALLSCVSEDKRLKLIMDKELGDLSPFLYAVTLGHIELSRLLFEFVPAEGIEKFVTARYTNHRMTALHLVACVGDIEMARLLLDAVPLEHRAAFIMARCREGFTVIDCAKRNGHVELAKMLIEYCGQDQKQEEEQDSKKRNRDGEDGDSGVPAPKVREKEQPKESGWGCNVM